MYETTVSISRLTEIKELEQRDLYTHAAWKHLAGWTDLLSMLEGILPAQGSVILSYQLKWRTVYI